MRKFLFTATAIIQTILHYIGWIAIFLGVVAFLFGNKERATELFIGGIGYLVLKYAIGIVFHVLISIGKKAE